MIVLVFIVIYVLLSGLRRLASRALAAPRAAAPRPTRVRPHGFAPSAETISYPDRVQDRWTPLDDRQLTRLLDDNAPC